MRHSFALAYNLISSLNPASHLWNETALLRKSQYHLSACLSFQLHATVSQGVLCDSLHWKDLKELSILFCFSYFRQLQTLNDPSFWTQHSPSPLYAVWLALCKPSGDFESILIIPLPSSSYLKGFVQICLEMPPRKNPIQYALPLVILQKNRGFLAEKWWISIDYFLT